MLFYLHSLMSFIKNTLFPEHCALCQKAGCLLCLACKNLIIDMDPQCTICGHPLPISQIKTCGQCLTKPPYFDRIYTIGNYDRYLQNMVLDFKFHATLHYALLFSALLAEKIQVRQLSLPECIIPVPLHKKRLKERGFNQALELAKPLSKRLKLPIDTQLCERIKHTQPQAGLRKKAREQNIKNAFRLKKTLPYQHIAIVDDVFTTGDTVNELSKILKQSGVKHIEVWCIARTTRTC